MMWISKKRLSEVRAAAEADHKFLYNRYWELWHQHQRLLNHLGLEEVRSNQPDIILVPKEPPK